MDRESRRATHNQVIVTSGTNVVAGIWLIVAPFVLGYASITAALWNDTVVGVLVVILAGTRISGAYQDAWLSWVNLFLNRRLLGLSDLGPASGARVARE